MHGEYMQFKYITNILLQHVATIRSGQVLTKKYAVLLMDSIGTHVSERVVKPFGKLYHGHRDLVHVMILFDSILIMKIVFFGAMKIIKQTIRNDFNDDFVEDQLTNLIQAYEQMAISFIILEGFRKPKFIRDSTKKLCWLAFNKEILRANERYFKIWNVKISADQFSKRRLFLNSISSIRISW
jgi:hypothetical protein